MLLLLCIDLKAQPLNKRIATNDVSEYEIIFLIKKFLVYTLSKVKKFLSYQYLHRTMQSFFNQINSYYPLSPAAQEALAVCFVKMEFYKNDILLKEGNVCRHLYFVEQGAVRGFYKLDGKEITHWFGFENDFVTSFHSFITGAAAVENIQFLDYSVVWAIQKEMIQGLFDEFHETERLVRIVYEKYYIRLEERFVNAHFKTASERYENLLNQMGPLPPILVLLRKRLAAYAIRFNICFIGI
jgi:signal-transduction protein with cAMP-binding, CBS, and nucleotidyltransferase domain